MFVEHQLFLGHIISDILCGDILSYSRKCIVIEQSNTSFLLMSGLFLQINDV